MDPRQRESLLIISGVALGCAAAAYYYLSLSFKSKSRLNSHSKFKSEGHLQAAKLNKGTSESRGSEEKRSPLVPLHDLASKGDDIILEQFTRNVQMLGEEGQMAVYSSFVVVIGLGGVGSHAASMLLRSGVGRLRLVDFDQVSLSSLNRHAVATREDVGTPKALCLKKHFLRILPEANIDSIVAMYNDETEEQCLSGNPDYVLDCIDNIDTKVSLLWACKKRGLRVLSSMGAGARADPTRIRIADIMESSIDPLSRAVRFRLKKLMQQNSNANQEIVIPSNAPEANSERATQLNLDKESSSEIILDQESAKKSNLDKESTTESNLEKESDTCRTNRVSSAGGVSFLDVESVFSIERPKTKLLPLPHPDDDPHDYQVVPGFRVRVIPVLGTIPAIFGQVMATHVITRLAQLDVQFEPIVCLGNEHYRVLHQRLIEREEQTFGSANNFELDLDDIIFVVKEIWHGRSARQQHEQRQLVTGRAMWRSMSTMTLTRWDASKAPSVDNLVLLTFEEAEAHDNCTLDEISLKQPDFFRFVTERLLLATNLY